MQFLLLSALLPAAMAAALKGRQSSSTSAFENWSSPDMTYDGDQILGTFSSSNSANSSSPGVTKTDYTSGSSNGNGNTLNVTVQNLISSLSIMEIFVAVHSDNVHLFELGKPVSEEISSFVSDGSDSFSSLSSQSLYGTILTNNGSFDLAPGQYLNFSLPISFPSNNSNNDDDGNNSLADKLDDNDASISIIGRLEGLNDVFLGVDGSDLGDRRESFTATVYTFEAGFLTVHSGYVNSSITFSSRNAAEFLTFA